MAHSNKFSLDGKTIWVAGETGLVGSSIIRNLQVENCKIISAPHDILDLTNQKQTYDWLQNNKPDIIIMAAGKVGGIGANSNNQAEFLNQNLSMAQNVIHGAHLADIDRLLYLGSSCIYPKNAKQPIDENELLSGSLEPTNEGYALAKIAGIKLCQYYYQQYGRAYISAMPTNLYGENDYFDEQKSHVIPSLILKIHKAKINGDKNVKLWGSGTPLREFLYVDDLAEAIIFLIKNYNDKTHMNIGSGDEISIQNLSLMLADIIDYNGEIIFDTNKPDGMMRKLLDSSKINDMGWNSQIDLRSGLTKTYQWFLNNKI